MGNGIQIKNHFSYYSKLHYLYDSSKFDKQGWFFPFGFWVMTVASQWKPPLKLCWARLQLPTRQPSKLFGDGLVPRESKCAYGKGSMEPSWSTRSVLGIVCGTDAESLLHCFHDYQWITTLWFNLKGNVIPFHWYDLVLLVLQEISGKLATGSGLSLLVWLWTRSGDLGTTSSSTTAISLCKACIIESSGGWMQPAP